MGRPHKALGILAFLFCLACVPARAQDSQYEFLPEIDTYLKLTPNFRVYVQAKDDRDGGDPTQFAIGPSIQFYLKPLLKLKNVTAFDLDDSKSRALVLETGYRYIIVPGSSPYDRLIVAVTGNFPLGAGFLLSDRNRADLDWKTKGFTWRYRNKLQIERTFSVDSYHFIPYVAAEPYYVDQYHKWSTTALFAGALLPVGKHVKFDPYFEYENNTGKKPNVQDYEFGLILDLYFSLVKK